MRNFRTIFRINFQENSHLSEKEVKCDSKFLFLGSVTYRDIAAPPFGTMKLLTKNQINTIQKTSIN